MEEKYELDECTHCRQLWLRDRLQTYKVYSGKDHNVHELCPDCITNARLRTEIAEREPAQDE